MWELNIQETLIICSEPNQKKLSVSLFRNLFFNTPGDGGNDDQVGEEEDAALLADPGGR